MTTTIKFTCRTTLLEAMAHFAYEADDNRRHLQQIRISDRDLVATNGHRLVVVPNRGPEDADPIRDPIVVGRIDEPFLLPTELVRHHVAGVRSSWVEYEDEIYNGTEWLHRRRSIHGAETTVEVTDHRAILSYGRITTAARIECINDEYPPIQQIFDCMTSEGPPVTPRFDPKLFSGVRELLRASDDVDGMRMHAWDHSANAMGPVEYRSYRGTRLVLMGMAKDADEAKVAREVHRKSIERAKAKTS